MTRQIASCNQLLWATAEPCGRRSNHFGYDNATDTIIGRCGRHNKPGYGFSREFKSILISYLTWKEKGLVQQDLVALRGRNPEDIFMERMADPQVSRAIGWEPR